MDTKNHPAWNSPVERELNNLTTAISHELRTPLTAIRGALGLLLSGKLNPQTDQGQRLLEIAANNAARLERLTQTIEDRHTDSFLMISPLHLQTFLLEIDLRSALECQEFQLFYQPIVCTQTQTILGFEALLRWEHPEQGYIAPSVFLPLAEKTNLMADLGLWVLKQACTQLFQWQREFPASRPLTMNVNLSPGQLLQPSFAQQVQQICLETKVSPSDLHLEITEKAIATHDSQALTTLAELKALGIKIYLDDFGASYNSFSQLRSAAVDALKIDHFFVSSGQWDLIRHIQLFAQEMGIETIVEGVETQEEWQEIQQVGCIQSQGYFFAKPAPAERAQNLLKNCYSYAEFN